MFNFIHRNNTYAIYNVQVETIKKIMQCLCHYDIGSTSVVSCQKKGYTGGTLVFCTPENYLLKYY